MKAVTGSSVVVFRCLAAAVLALIAGCSSPKAPPPSYIENIAVSFRFTNVDKPDERERVYRVAKSIAITDTLDPKDVPATPDFELRFVVPRLAALDDAHGRILFIPQAGGKAGDISQIFNPREPKFSIRYDTINIGGGIEVIVRFKVTPGAQLFYKPQGGALLDITSQVSDTGNVSFTTRLSRGQEYFYAKAISGPVTKWLKINVFSQQVQEITQSEFDGQK
jgi:hypothetical protein